MIKSMGGEHFNHLMSDVNYLIVGDRDTEKYRYSVRNRADIKFIRPNAILKIHEAWISGDDSSINIDDYLLPIFDHLNICLSRLNNHSMKQKIIELVEQNGGSITDSLTVNNHCVITNEKKGKRYDKALIWQIPTVGPIWIYDSIKRKAALEFKYYDISKLETSEIGKESCLVWEKLENFNNIDIKTNKRKLNQDNNDITTLKIPKKRENNLWGDIMGNVRPPSKKIIENKIWDEVNINNNNEEEEEKFENLTTKSNINRPIQEEQDQQISQLFLGFNFAIYGYDEWKKISTLIKVIRSHCGEVSVSPENDDKILLNDQTITHFLIPSTFEISKLPQKFLEFINKYDIKLITEWFIERCLHYNEIKYDKWILPIKNINLKFNLKICISGFSGIELLHIVKLIKLLGCEYCETLNSSRDLLIINLSIIGLNAKNSPKLFSYKYPEIISCKSIKTGITSTKNKINACKNWHIPIVSVAYLMEIGDQGELPELLDYRWCIFAPKFYEKTRNITGNINNKLNNNISENLLNEQIEQKLENENLNVIKIPSPLQKNRKNWGRIIGRAKESQFQEKKNLVLLQTQQETLENNNENDTIQNNNISTQISYNDTHGGNTINIHPAANKRTTRSAARDAEEL
ncbi:hypothetical protein PACTADRAFT_48708 [Pachysolen tannophilus NRRL Y-2460]|uniref:BRCT domain-containing protein n=1 Tax=Pachysolen tannophilus NRRL Y-2460 TaxID=669874 RepID=A0A1E4TYV0_PACTA|nr:hypothetical protein PACTADRAFT_48708 [Pachysolen tannophilus NRRL Y-2460]